MIGIYINLNIPEFGRFVEEKEPLGYFRFLWEQYGDSSPVHQCWWLLSGALLRCSVNFGKIDSWLQLLQENLISSLNSR